MIIRPRTIVGPERLGIFQILFEWIARHRPVYFIGSGRNRLQLVSIADLCAACVLAIDRAHGVTLGIGGRAFGTLREDIGALIAHARSRSRIVSLPAGPAMVGLRLLDWLRLSPLAPWHYLTFHADFFYDDAATATLGYVPRDSNVDILTQAYAWYLQHAGLAPSGVASPHRSTPKSPLLRWLQWLP